MSYGQTLRNAGSGSFSIPIAEEIEAYETQRVVFDLVLSIRIGNPLRANNSFFRKERIRTRDRGKAR